MEATTRRVTVTVRFTDEAVEHTRVYQVAPWARWTMTLDELRPKFMGMADAVVRIQCEGRCWAETALWHAPIGYGVAPTVTRIGFVCEAATKGTP